MTEVLNLLYSIIDTTPNNNNKKKTRKQVNYNSRTWYEQSLVANTKRFPTGQPRTLQSVPFLGKISGGVCSSSWLLSKSISILYPVIWLIPYHDITGVIAVNWITRGRHRRALIPAKSPASAVCSEARKLFVDYLECVIKRMQRPDETFPSLRSGRSPFINITNLSTKLVFFVAMANWYKIIASTLIQRSC